MQPKIYIRYLPNRPGSVWALFYIESDADLYGWCTEAAGPRFSASFFMIENFYTNRTTCLYRSVQDDVYGEWLEDAPRVMEGIRCPVPEPVRHELERIQSNFVEEWLFFATDPIVDTEFDAYRTHGFPIQAVNVKSRRLNRLDKASRYWVHNTPHMDLHVVEFLQKYGRFNGKNSALDL